MKAHITLTLEKIYFLECVRGKPISPAILLESCIWACRDAMGSLLQVHCVYALGVIDLNAPEVLTQVASRMPQFWGGI